MQRSHAGALPSVTELISRCCNVVQRESVKLAVVH